MKSSQRVERLQAKVDGPPVNQVGALKLKDLPLSLAIKVFLSSDRISHFTPMEPEDTRIWFMPADVS